MRALANVDTTARTASSAHVMARRVVDTERLASLALIAIATVTLVFKVIIVSSTRATNTIADIHKRPQSSVSTANVDARKGTQALPASTTCADTLAARTLARSRGLTVFTLVSQALNVVITDHAWWFAVPSELLTTSRPRTLTCFLNVSATLDMKVLGVR